MTIGQLYFAGSSPLHAADVALSAPQALTGTAQVAGVRSVTAAPLHRYATCKLNGWGNAFVGFGCDAAARPAVRPISLALAEKVNGVASQDVARGSVVAPVAVKSAALSDALKVVRLQSHPLPARASQATQETARTRFLQEMLEVDTGIGRQDDWLAQPVVMQGKDAVAAKAQQLQQPAQQRGTALYQNADDQILLKDQLMDEQKGKLAAKANLSDRTCDSAYASNEDLAAREEEEVMALPVSGQQLGLLQEAEFDSDSELTWDDKELDTPITPMYEIPSGTVDNAIHLAQLAGLEMKGTLDVCRDLNARVQSSEAMRRDVLAELEAQNKLQLQP